VTRSEIERLKGFMKSRMMDIALHQDTEYDESFLIGFIQKDLIPMIEEFAENMQSTGDLE